MAMYVLIIDWSSEWCSSDQNATKFVVAGGKGAVAHFREALRLRPGDARAMQGLAAAESALIRQAELAANQDDYAAAEDWLAKAAKVRPEMDTAADDSERIARQRASRVGNLRDLGLGALTREDLDAARRPLAALLRNPPGGATAAVRPGTRREGKGGGRKWR